MVSRGSITSALVLLLALPLSAGAQETPGQGPVPLELRREREAAPRRPAARPDGQRDQAVREAERAAADYERTQRDESLMREQSRPAPRRPDLGYDVYGGIQQRNVPRR